VKKLILTFGGFIVALNVAGQIDFSRYFDDSSLPFLNTEDHLDIHFKWDMKGMVQAHINEGLNNLAEDKVVLAKSNFDEAIKLDSTLWLSYYYRGICQKKLKAFKDAESDFRVCIRRQPGQAEPYLELGEIYHEHNSFDTARDLYEKAIDADPKLVHGYYNLANVEFATSDARKALKLYEKCNEIAPKFPDAYMAQGILKFKVRKNDNQSIDFFAKAIAVDSTFSQAYFWRGLAYLSLNQPEKCLKDWNKVITLNPNNTFLIMMRGFLRIEMDQYDYAFVDLRKALMSREVDENQFVSGQTVLDKRIDLQSLANYLVRNGYGLKDETFTLIRKSFCLMLAGREQAALKAASQAERLEQSATVYYTRAIIYEHLKKHDSAFYDYGKALRYDKDIFDAHKKRGIYWYELKNYAMSYQHFDAMFRLQPESPVAYRLRGLIRSNEGNYKGAVDDLAKYLKADSTDSEALRSIAICKINMGDNYGANEDLRRILYFEPKNWMLYEDVYTNYLNLGDTIKAIEIIKLYTSKDPRIITPYLDLIRIYYKRNQWEDVKAGLQQAQGLVSPYKTSTHMADLLFYEGMLNVHYAEYDKAVDNFSTALKLNPRHYGCTYYRALAYEQKGELKKALADLKTLKGTGYMDSNIRYDALVSKKNK